MIDASFAFYKGETPLFEGDVTLRAEYDPDRPGKEIHRISADDRPDLTMSLEETSTHLVDGKILRKDFTGYLLQQGGVIRCSVDMDIPTEHHPDVETIGRAMIASALDDLNQPTTR